VKKKPSAKRSKKRPVAAFPLLSRCCLPFLAPTRPFTPIV
jgi:hypothetical protein